MANQTVTTAVNHDSVSVLGLLNGETYTINGGSLLVNGDVRWGQNAAILGDITINSSLGGSILFDGRDVWEIPFDASSGNVPVLNALGSNGVTGGTSGATGELFRVWAAGELTPRASGGAMPTNGYIKLRTKTGTFLDNETITLPGGATATVNSPTGGKRSWIQIVGARSTTVTVPRLGKLEALGDWYELGATNGQDNQTIQLPFIDAVPAIQIETAPGSNVYEWWLNAGNRWQSAHANALSFIPVDERGKYFGQTFRREDAGTTSGSNIVTVASTAGLEVGAPIAFLTGFIDPDNLYISEITNATSFRVSTNSNSTGTNRLIIVTQPTLQLAFRGDFNCGLKPEAGCKIRIPNVILGTSTAGPNDSNLWRGQIQEGVGTDRWDINTTLAGAILYNKILDSAYFGASVAAYSVEVRDSCSFAQIHSNTATAPILNNCGVGISGANVIAPITFSNQFTGLEMDGVFASRYSDSSGASVFSIVDCANISIQNCKSQLFGSLTSIAHSHAAVNTYSIVRCFDVQLMNIYSVGGGISLSQVSRCSVSNIQFSDLIGGETVTTHPASAIRVTDTSSSIFIDGFSNYAGLTNVHPYAEILNCGTSSSGVELRNVGTPTSPYNMGSANACGRIASANVSANIILRRCYTFNTRLDAFNFANTVQNVLLENVWGDYNDLQAVRAIVCLIKGGRWTNSVTEQSSVYGRHWEDAFTGATTGRILIACNEPLSSTASQAISSFGPRSGYTSSGSVSMVNVGDSVTWEMPYFALGHTALANSTPTFTGTRAGNHLIEFQYDLGSGYNGTWLTANASNLSGVGAINPEIGVKLKVRATITTAANDNTITYIRFNTETNSSAQLIEYPLPVISNEGTISGFAENSRIVVYNETEEAVVYDEISAGTTLSIPYDEGDLFTTGDIIRIYHIWYSPDGSSVTKKGLATAVAGENGWSVFLEQELDNVYEAYFSTYGVTGMDVDLSGDFSRDIFNLHIDLDDTDNLWFAHRLYQWDKYDIWNNSGRRDVFIQVSAIDAGNLSIGNLLLDNVTATTAYQGDTINVTNSASSLPVVNPTSGGGGITMYSGGKVLTTSSGGISPSEAQIKSWVRSELAIEMARIDAAISSRASSAVDTLIENVSGNRFTAKALEEAPSSGGGSGLTLAEIEASTVLAKVGSAMNLVSSYDAAKTAASQLSVNAIPTNPLLTNDVRLNNLDATISSRSTYNGDDTSGVTTLLSRVTGPVLLASNYTTPDNTSISSILADTNELQNNQGNWLTATGFATPANISSAEANIINAIPTAANIRSEIDSNSTKLDVAVSTRSTYDGSDTSGVATLLSRVAGNVLLASQYEAPDNAGIANIVDRLPSNSARIAGAGINAENLDQIQTGTGVTLAEIESSTVLAKEATLLERATPSDITSALNTYDGPTKTELDLAVSSIVIPSVSDIRNELSVELSRIDADVSSCATLSDITYALNTYDSPTKAELDTSTDLIINSIPTTTEIRSELSTELLRIDANISSRSSVNPDNTSISAIKSKTDNLPLDPASQSLVSNNIASLPSAVSIRNEIDENSEKLTALDKRTKTILAVSA
jgi:hypothetical protein